MVLALTIAVSTSSAVAAPPNPKLTKVLERLRASTDEWRREDAAFRISRKQGKLNRTEFEDYAGYVVSLRLRVLKQCEVARELGGEDAIKGYDCVPLGPNQGGRLVVVPSVNVQTEEEKLQILNARLNAIEAEIDEDLLKRQQEIRKTASNRHSGGAGGGSGGGAISGKSSGGNARVGKGSPSKSYGGTPTPSGPTSKDKHKRIAKRQQSNEGGSDDDVIARQLREAAEKESDPIMKGKLWEEYRKYKGAQK